MKKVTLRNPTKLKKQNSWWCETCGDDVEMTYEEMAKHLSEAHGCKVGAVTGSSTTLSHMDGPEWCSWQYSIALDGKSGTIVLHNTRMVQKLQDEAAFDE